MATRKKRPAKKASKKKASRGRRGKNVVSVDFTDVESGGGMPTPDGYYVGEVTKAEQEVSQNGNDMITVRWKTNTGSSVFDRFVLVPQSLWVLRTALECMGYDIPDGPFDFDPEDLVGNTCGLEITNEEYEEKDQPRVTGYMTPEIAEAEIEKAGGYVDPEEQEEEGEEEEEGEYEEDEGEEEEEETPAPAPKKKASKKKKAPAKKKKKASGALRPGARVVFEDEDGEEFQGVIEGIEDDIAIVVDDEEGEWEIPVAELKKA
jgi:hypothetical protein